MGLLSYVCPIHHRRHGKAAGGLRAGVGGRCGVGHGYGVSGFARGAKSLAPAERAEILPGLPTSRTETGRRSAAGLTWAGGPLWRNCYPLGT